jgi:hypothetical protein
MANPPISDAAIRAAFMMDAPKPAFNMAASVRKAPKISPRKPPKATLSAYKPSLGERIENGIADMLGGGSYARHFAGRAIAPLNDVTPVGDAISFADAGTAFGRGNYASAAGNAALGAIGLVPGAGDLAAKGIKGLGFPSQFNVPRVPTAEEMARASQVQRVALGQARHGNGLEWDKFNSGSHAVPLVPGYADKPLAVQLENGEYVLMDGNHRAALAQHQGASDMEMHVIPARQYDPENMGRAPVPFKSKMSDDDLAALLAEFGG